ncbi:hypothetical protein CEE37_11525 [candidate division LCP-89 bacterium B3_LCP]|uniref:Calcineurin-like phosphoesterase domain-containing protein n=1 Tax=candidate division LCP-89 bacterium B3_LCP TaxID=2012998 RepID=A0A532UW87_UNCL8|nr:MAG: hypothetical protein CEE37_11525 [candidate division LCP-89 bacterium B3_LCP]
MILFISDAHLGTGSLESQQKRKLLLKELFDHYAPKLDRMVIIGDLFDFWFEWKHVILKKHFQVLFWLKELHERGVEIHFLAGNHDFALGSFLAEEVGVQVHMNEYSFNYDGKSFFALHGDGLAPADWGYRILKRVLRSRFNQKLYSYLHPNWAVDLALKSSRRSRNYSGRRWDIDGWAYSEAAEKYIRQGNDYVLFAHNHESILKPMGDGIYVNTGDWMKHFSYAEYANGKMELKYWGKPFIKAVEPSKVVTTTP